MKAGLEVEGEEGGVDKEGGKKNGVGREGGKEEMFTDLVNISKKSKKSK